MRMTTLSTDEIRIFVLGELLVRKMQKRPTLKDVAAYSQVSIISASRALRGLENVSPELRAKVEAAADALGYSRNPIAGSLRGQSSDLVVVLVPAMTNNVFPAVVDGIYAGLSQTGLGVVLGLTGYGIESEERVLRNMLAWSPAGLVLSGSEHTDDTEAMLAEFDGPIVEVMDIDGETERSQVGLSHLEAGRMMADHFLKCGYRRIGYIGAWGEQPLRSRKRRISFEEELRRNGVELVGRFIHPDPSSVSVGAESFDRLIEEHSDLEAIFFANDDLALGAMSNALDRGLSIPDDMAFAGFNGLDVCDVVRPHLTTIVTPRFEVGCLAGKIIADTFRTGENKGPQQRRELALELRQGGTTRLRNA
ncbi:LacI family DNA-binding transcriptional regulator [Fulvimarina endophytica]|uniref:LacI family DNA-binding transcriptional regulator n=2 Tax=Fulvimarina endophytica TaxID=2293836 RepID=A0A371X5A7_9HYPH|nr:LacI family DNA-binding transcriptional regulator [Fulvimarina endophytica]